MQTIHVELKERSYQIKLARGIISHLKDFMDVNQRIFLITDQGVPTSLVNQVANQFNACVVYPVIQGEGAKSFEVYESCLRSMIKHQFGRHDAVVALGGGVVGDLSGFVAASYMRGIDFIQIPTTTLSQIDSSIGGKVAINVDGVKNCVGAFWQPKLVLIDPDSLHTLTKRHFNNGLVEALKAGCLADEALVSLFEEGEIDENLEEILYRSLMFKKSIVEQDETETGIRRLLNFGHTLGHGIESYYHLSDVYHGEAVALGMMMVIEQPVIKERLKKIYEKLQLKTEIAFDSDKVYEYIRSDKKGKKEGVSMIKLLDWQKPIIEDVPWESVKAMLKGVGQ